jgi:hypothetical protein
MKAIKCFSILKKLVHLSPRDRKLVIDVFDRELIDAISECALNIVKNKVKVNKKTKAKLKQYQREIITLSDKKSSPRVKRQIINQEGGAILPFLIQPVLGILASLFADKVFNGNR